MSFPTHSEMHEAHLEWQSEHASWMADLDRWQTERGSAARDLATLESLLEAHGEELGAHARAIRAHGNELQSHEIALAELERGGSNDRREEVIGQHFLQLEEHSEQMVRHERLAKHHRAVLDQLHALIGLLLESPTRSPRA